MGFTILEVVPKAEEKPEALLKMLQFSMKDASPMPSTSNNITLSLNKDDVETIEMVLKLAMFYLEPNYFSFRFLG